MLSYAFKDYLKLLTLNCKWRSSKCSRNNAGFQRRWLSNVSIKQRWSRGHKARGQNQGRKKIQGQGQKCSMPRPRTKDTNASVFLRKKVLKFFSVDLQKKWSRKTFSADLQNFNHSKNSAVLEPRTRQFSRTWGFEAKAKDLKMCPRGFHLCKIMLPFNISY